MSVIARVQECHTYVSADAGVTWTPWNGGAAGSGLTDAQLRATPVPVSGTVTTSPPSNASTNVAQFGGSAVVTGAGPAGSGVPRVTVSGDDISTSTTLNSQTTLVLAVAGCTGVSAEIQAGTLNCTLAFQSSFDGGVTYSTGFAVVAGVQSITTTVFAGTNARTTVDWILSEGVSHVRINCNPFVGGSAVVWMRATQITSPVAVGALSAGLNGSAVPFFSTLMGGKAATILPTATAGGNSVAAFYDSTGRQITRPWNSWHVNNVPAVATAATITQASGGVGVKNVCTSITVSISSTAAPTAGAVQFNLRDGATGVGTILWSVKLSIAAVAGNAQCLTLPVWIEGTAATAMTLETAAAPAAGTFATVAMSGTLTT